MFHQQHTHTHKAWSLISINKMARRLVFLQYRYIQRLELILLIMRTLALYGVAFA